MPRFSQIPADLPHARADSRNAVCFQTEPNPCVEQQAAFQLGPLLGDFDAL